MAKDGRELREEAAAATVAGKYKRALAAYLELERIEPRDAQWAKRAAETYRKLGNNKHAIEAFERSCERYSQNGFLVQAIAVCKLILQIDPQNANALSRLAQLNEQAGQGPTRAQGFAENNPALHANPNVAAIRRTGHITSLKLTPAEQAQADAMARAQEAAAPRWQTEPLPPVKSQPMYRTRNKPTTPPSAAVPISVSRTKSKPIQVPPGAALETVNLAKQMPQTVMSSPGVHVLPIDDEDLEIEIRTSSPGIEIEGPDEMAIDAEVEVSTELALEDIEEIPLGQPRPIGMIAARALAATPLFAGLPKEALEALVSNLTLVSLDTGSVLFREGDPGDALYVIVEGEVSVQAEGPPRVEMARLGPGTFIGEVALLTDQVRSATVTAVQTSELLRIDRHTLSRVLANHGDVLRALLRFVRDRLVDRWMRTSPLFRPFSDEQRVELAAKFKFLEIEPSTVLLGAGQRPDGLYIVLAGHFNVVRDKQNVAILGPGDLIGETALLSSGVFKSDVISRGKGLALCLPAPAFREIIMTHPHVLEVIGEQAEQSRRLQIL
ncbi:MAG: cyclic nucleotide-binding domain-containing protein [Kofleriaceae bacterium]